MSARPRRSRHARCRETAGIAALVFRGVRGADSPPAAVARCCHRGLRADGRRSFAPVARFSGLAVVWPAVDASRWGGGHA